MDKARILLDTPAEAPALGFDRTAKALGMLIEESAPRFAVGIFGGWGSGKTTLMQAIRQELNRDSTLKVEFNAWRYEREPHLIVPLLDTIRADLVRFAREKPDDLKSKLDGIAAAIGRVVGALARGVSAELSIGFAKLTYEADKTVDGLNAGRSEPERSQSLYFAAFERLAEAFADLHDAGVERIVVFVDDLDRCLPPNALAVIESMKLFFDLTGFVFVVGIDQRVLEQAVRERLAGPNAAAASEDRRVRLAEREYMKKIFQVPYELPPMAAEQLDELLASVYRTAGIEGEQLTDLKQMVRPYLEHLAIEGQVNPREVKRFINAYTLQMLVRPHLDRATVLAVQTLVFRDDWALYEILRAETDALPEAIRLYRDDQNSALADLWPQIGNLPPDLAQFLRSAQAAPLTGHNLRVYLTSVDATVTGERWVGRAYALIGKLRRTTRTLTPLVEQDAGANEIDGVSRDLGGILAELRSLVVEERRASSRFEERLAALNSSVRKLNGLNESKVASWTSDAEGYIADLQMELRLMRGPRLDPAVG